MDLDILLRLNTVQSFLPFSTMNSFCFDRVVEAMSEERFIYPHRMTLSSKLLMAIVMPRRKSLNLIENVLPWFDCLIQLIGRAMHRCCVDSRARIIWEISKRQLSGLFGTCWYQWISLSLASFHLRPLSSAFPRNLNTKAPKIQPFESMDILSYSVILDSCSRLKILNFNLTFEI